MTITLRQWAEQTKERLGAVQRRSIELLGDEMTRTKANGGRVPVDTGNLARSLLASQEAMPKTSDTVPSGMDVGAFAATMDVSKPTWLGYQSRYARRVNSGFVGADSLGRVYNQQGQHFVEGAAAEWQNIVNRAIADVKATSKPSKS